MTDRRDLDRLTRVARSKPNYWRLCCPSCRGDVELAGGLLVCAWCGNTYQRLVQLEMLAEVPRG